MANIMKRNKSKGGELATTRSLMPFGGLVDSGLQNMLNRFWNDDFWGFGDLTSTTSIPVNIRETDKHYELEIVAPGMKKEDFSIGITNNILTVSFEHKEEDNEENKANGYLRQEYRMQSFSRSFTLDETINAEKISAQYRDGVLLLSLPKKEGAQRITKNIEVK